MKIALLCVSTQTVLNFRMPLIDRLQKEGHMVSVVCFDDVYQKEIEDKNIAFFHFQNSNRSLNPLGFLSLISNYKTILSEIKPDLVFTFMVKPNIFGTMAAHKLGITRLYAMVEGAGDPFIKTGVKWKVIRAIECFLYKKAFKYDQKVFFLNSDDIQQFISLKLVDASKALVIPGIGVDIERFACKEVNSASKKFLMVARMLQTKGVWDYIHCAELVKAKHPDAEFGYLGGEGDVTISAIQPYINNGTLTYYGTTTDVRPYLYDILALILPSCYREGLPMSIMEAESCGRAIITYDSVGCKETTIHGFNGFVLPVHDLNGLAEACISLLEDKTLCAKMGRASRQLCEEKFNQEIINTTLLQEIGVL